MVGGVGEVGSESEGGGEGQGVVRLGVWVMKPLQELELSGLEPEMHIIKPVLWRAKTAMQHQTCISVDH